LYYNTDKLRFKNISFRSGFVDRVSFVPLNENVISEFRLIDVDKSTLRWGEEREIAVRYDLVLTPETCSQLAQKREFITWQVRFYDNVGKLIDKYSNGDLFTIHERMRPQE